MTADDSLDIQFGEVEETKPEVRLRPDANKHFAVATVYSPRDGELPVYVDLDAMRDMEEHALSDTGVELGGVMLGGQYEDEDGRPFVLVTDSLRAQHYESTKGSFKFTHDTWSQITRERDEFPDDIQMVGWYHTHPDWGVFLSGMDMFICNNFFNKKLDVALVIDPCRQDRGFFQWSPNSAEGTLRTGGFYLIASRFREHELGEFATYLEGQFTMAGDPRFRGTSSGSSPIINVGGQQAWQTVAIFSMLTVQFCFLMLMGWRMLTPEPATKGPSEEVIALRDSLDQLAKAHRERAEIDAKLEVLDEVVGNWDGTSQPIVKSLTNRPSQLKDLRGSLRRHEALENEQLAKMQEQESTIKGLDQQREFFKQESARWEAQWKKADGEIERLSAALAKYEKTEAEPEASAEAEQPSVWARNWKWIAGGVAAAVIALGAASFLIPPQRGETEKNSEETDATTN